MTAPWGLKSSATFLERELHVNSLIHWFQAIVTNSATPCLVNSIAERLSQDVTTNNTVRLYMIANVCWKDLISKALNFNTCNFKVLLEDQNVRMSRVENTKSQN